MCVWLAQKQFLTKQWYEVGSTKTFMFYMNLFFLFCWRPGFKIWTDYYTLWLPYTPSCLISLHSKNESTPLYTFFFLVVLPKDMCEKKDHYNLCTLCVSNWFHYLENVFEVALKVHCVKVNFSSTCTVGPLTWKLPFWTGMFLQ